MRFLAAALIAFLAAACGASARSPAPPFRHVVVIVFENKDESSVLGSGRAPTFDSLARRYARLTRYYGVAHPSLPNYLALVSGSTHGIATDCTGCTVDAPNLVDSLEHAGKTWKTYAEGLPAPGYTGASAGRRYVKKHVPFLYFRDIVRSTKRLTRVVPLRQLSADLAAGKFPDFAQVVPDLCHSMHDCSIDTGDAWLRSALPPLLKLRDTVVFVIFDEGVSSARIGGHVAALAAGTAVRPGSSYTSITNHYGVLRTIEQAWDLPLLGRSAQVAPITGIWR